MVASAVSIAKTYSEIHKSGKTVKKLDKLGQDKTYENLKGNVAKAKRFEHQAKESMG